VAESFAGRIRFLEPVDGETFVGTGEIVTRQDRADASSFAELGFGEDDGDGDGGFYFTDRAGCRLLRARVEPTGLVVERMAGTGVCDFSQAGALDRPSGLARHPSFPDSVFVAAEGSSAIMRVDLLTHEVAVVAGRPGSFGAVDGVGPDAGFESPLGMTWDPVRDVILIADANSNSIRTFDPVSGAVGTLAGDGGGYVDGPGEAARFRSIRDVTVGLDGTVYVADAGNCALRAIDADDVVRTVVGGPERCGTADGPADEARVRQLLSVSALPDGRIVATDGFRSRIVIWDPLANTLDTLVGDGFGERDGDAAQARVRIPKEAFASGGMLIMFDVETSRIRALGL
jgi:hypothetical protein